MSRQRMPANLKQGKSETKAELEQRAAIEETLKGNTDKFRTPPDKITRLAQAYYEFLVNELEEAKILADLDIPLLTNISDVLAKIDMCKETIQAEGMFVTVNGIPKEHPAVNTKLKFLKEFRAMAGSLGLSPSARAAMAGDKMQAEEAANTELMKILNPGN